MIETNVMVEDAGSRWVVYQFILEDTSGAGIQKITLVDQFGMELEVPQPEGCPRIYGFITERINRGRLPLGIESINCSQETTPRDVAGPIGAGKNEGKGAIPCSATDCADDPECNQAVADVIHAQNAITPICRRLADIGGQITAREWERGFAVALAILLTALAGVLWYFVWVVGIDAAAVATATAIAAWGAVAAMQRLLDRLYEEAATIRAELREAESALDEVISLAYASCCPGCITVPLDSPCSL